MGKFCFSKILTYTCLAAITLAAAFLAATTAANPASAAGETGRGNLGALKSWDTDNLARWVSFSFGTVGARNYRIPYHNYRASGYKESEPARPCVGIGNNKSANRNLYTGQCPQGYTLATHVCQYHQSHFRETHIFIAPSSGNCPTRNIYEWRTQYEYNPYREYAISVLVASKVQGLKLAIGSLNRGACLYEGGAVRFAASCTQTIPVHPGCQSAVADAFFQTGGDTGAVNDFPVASYGSESEAGTVAATGRRDRGCVEFAKQQDRLQASVAATGHYLALEGGELVLKANSGTDILPTTATSVRSAAVYGRWYDKGTGYKLAQHKTGAIIYLNTVLPTLSGGVYPTASSSDYQRRVDTRSALAMGSGLGSALVHPWSDSSGSGLGAGQGSWACPTGTGQGCVGLKHSGPNYFRTAAADIEDLGTGSLFRVTSSPLGTSHWWRQVHLVHAQDSGGGWCPAKWHPRGQDAAYAIGRSTGRTLSSISSETLLKLADDHWCRSDVRYRLQFTAQQHNTCGNNRRSPCAGPPGVALPAVGSEFPSYGRKNCYKTMTGYNEGTAECEYVFPLPECDPDPDNDDNTDWREFTAAEVDNIGVAGEPLLVKEGAYCGTNINPPDLAGFDADPCVAVDVAVFENRPAGENAEPGVDADDRIAAVSSSVAVYDLDISAPFPDTASPPKEDSDPSGCADGEEERTNHGARANSGDATLPAASDGRKSTAATADPASPNAAPYPLPSSSSASNTAAPPSDYDADNSYAGARANIAHRYASAIAENTCAAKKEEAALVLAVLKARADSFSQWLLDYKTAADSNRAKFAGYNAVARGATGLRAHWAQDLAEERNRAARVLYTAYGELSAALVSARTRYNTARSGVAVAVASSASGCVKHYDYEIKRLKDLFADAEKNVLKSSATGIGDAELPVQRA